MSQRVSQATSKPTPSGTNGSFSLRLAVNPLLSVVHQESQLYSKWILTTILLFLSYIVHFLTRREILASSIAQWLIPALSLTIFFSVGLSFIQLTIGQWREYGSKINLTLAGTLALALSLYESFNGQILPFYGTSSFVFYVVLILTYFEIKIQNETNLYVDKIDGLRPKKAHKIVDGEPLEVSFDQIVLGDTLKIATGEVIPCDGTILSGTTSVDESPLTGKFSPILKEKGDSVIGCSINRDSQIVIVVDRPPNENILQTILTSLKSHESSHQAFYTRTDRLAKTLSFLGIICACVAGYFHHFMLGSSLVYASEKALSILVAFSSASLVPSVIILSKIFLSRLFHHGIVIRNQSALAVLSQLDTLFFDKTGTLTRGNFEYSQTFIELGTNQGRILSTLFSLESQSSHPLSQSMETHPWFYEIPKFSVKNFETHSGLGVCGTIQPKGEREYFAAVGNLRFLKRMQMYVTRDMKNKIDDLETVGETVLLCGFDRQVKGLISFSDVLRPNVREALSQIKSFGIEPAIVTGDSIEDLNHLTSSLKLQKVYSRCTPDEKTAKISKEISNGKTVGIVCSPDDMQKFSNAHVSLTLDAGTDIKKHLTDIVFMGPDFSDISWLIENCRELSRSTKSNMIAALLSTAAMATFAITGIATAELITSLLFVSNIFILRSVSTYKQKENRVNSSSPAISFTPVPPISKIA